MQHLGDITKISGYTAPIVDCVIGGSPCQGMSMAGLGGGLDDDRSVLFFEQVRVTKEMRKQDERNGRSGIDVRPRWLVWENVPGAFSRNGGRDFRIVLEELARVVEEGVTIPRPPSGKWKTSGVIIGDGYSIAWRVMDAQHFGVPQRRRRIVLVADFGGHFAPRVVFGDGQHLRGSAGVDSEQIVRRPGNGRGQEVSSVGDRLRRDTPPCGEKRQGVAAHAEGSPGADDRKGAGGAVGFDGYNAACTGDKSATLGVNCGLSSGRNGVVVGVDVYNQSLTGDKSKTLNSAATDSDHIPVAVLKADDIVETVALEGNGQRPSHRGDGYAVTDKSYTLNATEVHGVAYGFDPGASRDVGALFIEECAKTLTIGTCPGHHDGVVNEITPIEQAIQAVKEVYKYSGVGSGLHIVLDDENIEDHHIVWCVENTIPAIENDAEKQACEVCAHLLLGLTYREREQVMGCYWRSQSTKEVQGVVYAMDRASFNQGKNAQYDFEITDSGVNSTLVAKGPSAVAYAVGNGQADNTGLHDIPGALNCMHDQQAVLLGIPPHYIVRRLTPTECARLQGFPDGWTDIGDWVDSKGKKHKAADSPRYKALGNSIALPVWKIILKRLCAYYERDATMASLFDGIGGFPYLWEQINGEGSCLWASEIEEFPMAVTKKRINKE